MMYSAASPLMSTYTLHVLYTMHTHTMVQRVYTMYTGVHSTLGSTYIHP